MTAGQPTHLDTHHMNAVAWLTWAIPGVVWGTSFFFIAECLDAFPAPMITPLRVLLGFATLALVPTALRTRIDRADLPRVVLLGVIWMAVPLSLFPFAEQHVSSSVTGMLNGATPIFVTVVAAAWAKARPHRIQVMGLLLGLGGVVLIALPAGNGDSSWGGIALIFVALVFYGFALNVAVPLQRRYGALPVLWRTQGVAFLLTAPWGLATVGEARFEWAAAMAMVALGVLGTALAYVLMADNAGRLGSSRASASVYLIPVVSLALGAMVRNEQVAVWSVVGCGVALVGAWLAGRQPPRPAPGGDTHEATVVEDLAAPDAQRFWSQVDTALQQRDQATGDKPDSAKRVEADVDAAFDGID